MTPDRVREEQVAVSNARRSYITIGFITFLSGVATTIAVWSFTVGFNYAALQHDLRTATDGVVRHDARFNEMAAQFVTMNNTLLGEQRYADAILNLQKQIVDLNTGISSNAGLIASVNTALGQLREQHGAFVAATNEHMRFLDDAVRGKRVP